MTGMETDSFKGKEGEKSTKEGGKGNAQWEKYESKEAF
jgi:hypothetical protein